MCSLRSLSPTRKNRSFNSTGLCILKYELGTSQPNFSMTFLSDNELFIRFTYLSVQFVPF